MSFIKKVFGLEEEFEEEYYEEETAAPTKARTTEIEPSTRTTRTQQKQNVVSIQSAPSKQSSGAKVMLIEARAYSEVQQIADHLLSKRAVVINLQQVEYDQAKRIVDFLSGTTYAVGGDIKKIGASTFLCTPDNVDVSGQISDLHIDYDNSTKGW